MTGEVAAYVEVMRNVIGRAQRKKPTVGVIIVSPPWVHTLAEATPTIAVLAIRSRSRTKPAILYRSPESKGQCHGLAFMQDLILCIPG